MSDAERATIEGRLVRVEEGLKFTRADVADLKATVARVGWIVVAAVLVALIAQVVKAA